MTLFVDPQLLPCFDGITTLPSSDTPLAWRRMLAFDDCLASVLDERESASFTVERFLKQTPGWQSYVDYLRDAAKEPLSKAIYICCHRVWYELYTGEPADDFQITTLFIEDLGCKFTGFKDGDLVVCPGAYDSCTRREITDHLEARDKAIELEDEIPDLSLKPYPLTLDDLIGRLAEEIKRLHQSGVAKLLRLDDLTTRFAKML